MALTIFMDESGFTGDDLFNPQQPFFTIGSTVVENEEAGELLHRCFPRYQGKEFKFTNVWKRSRSRDGLLNLAAEIPKFSDNAFVWIIDKRFCLLTKMVDYLVEPAAYEAGFDWYSDGWGMRYLNNIHFDLVNNARAQVYDSLVKSWDYFARNPSEEALTRLEDNLSSFQQTTDDPLPSLFDLLLKGASHFRQRNANFEQFTDTNEIQVTSIFSTLTWWRQRREEDFALIHDDSTAFSKQRELWETMIRDDYSSKPLSISDGSEVELPLRVKSTQAVRSEDSYSVQLSDLLAGLLAKAGPGLVGGEKDPFITELIIGGAGHLNYRGVMPHELFIDGPPKRRSGPDALDRMVDLLEPYFVKDREGSNERD